MSVIRAFIAIDISQEILAQLSRISEDLKQKTRNGAIRWVPVENIHLTLKFLGDVSLNNLEFLTDVLKSEVSGHKQFVMSVGGIGAFPRVSHPRVIWVGIEAPDELLAVQRGIEAQMARLGYERDARSFSAHLTLGRISRSASPHDVRAVADILSGIKIGFLGVTRVEDVHLFRSDLRPDGAVYTRIFTAALQSRLI